MNLILGAGISGITFARSLGLDCLILERENHAGGLCTEYSCEDFSFPYGGHYFHFQGKESLLPILESVSSFRTYQRDSRVFLKNKFIPFPIQYHLRYLTAIDRKRIFEEIFNTNPSKPDDLESWLLSCFGPSLFKLFFQPFLEKYYSFPLSSLMADMDKGSIPTPSPEQIREGFNGKRCRNMGYNPVFFYPRNASLKSFISRFSAPILKKIRFNEEVTGIDTKKRTVITRNSRYSYKQLINTLPLKRFLELCSDEKLREASFQLQHLSTIIFNGVLKYRRKRFHWVYLPERHIPCYRIGYYPSKGAYRFYLEATAKGNHAGQIRDIERALPQILQNLGMIRNKSEILYTHPKTIPVSYILFNRKWSKTVPRILNKLKASDIHSIGRYGGWNYTSMTDDIIQARDLANLLNHP